MSKQEKKNVFEGAWDIRRDPDFTEKFVAASRKKETRLKEKNTLDSDEEDAEREQYTLDRRDLEAQEEATVDVDDGIQITPFNMRMEMEEGRFDADGTYIPNKMKDIHDNWIDEVDWSKVKETEKLAQRRQEAEMEEEESEDMLDETKIYRQMLTLMKPGETVAKAISRLGSSDKKNPASRKRPGQGQVWKQKRQKIDDKAELNRVETDESSGSALAVSKDRSAKSQTSSYTDPSKEDLLRMIGYADSLVSSGNMTIYSDTFEGLSYKVKVKDEKSKPVLAADSGFDMFGDDTTKDNKSTTESVATKLDEPESSEIKWEYKWKNVPDAEIHGPYTSKQMLDWTNDGYFSEGIYARKTNNKDGQFYTSRRIDFELYL